MAILVYVDDLNDVFYVYHRRPSGSGHVFARSGQTALGCPIDFKLPVSFMVEELSKGHAGLCHWQ